MIKVKMTGNSLICTQCNQKIENDSKLFIDAVGRLEDDVAVFSEDEVSIYHYECLIVEKTEDK